MKKLVKLLSNCEDLTTPKTLGGGASRLLGFTLAEVLITLGVIGVVAAMTMPSLIEKHQKHVTETKLKVAYQLFSEVIERAKLENEGTIDISKELLLSLPTQASEELTSMYFDPYIEGAEKYKGASKRVANTSNKGTYIIPSYNRASCIPKKGFCYWVYNHSTNYRDLHIDINGPNGPNIAGKDIFSFRLSGPAPTTDITALKLGSGTCDKTSTGAWNGYGCTKLIVNNGWKIPDDYPW